MVCGLSRRKVFRAPFRTAVLERGYSLFLRRTAMSRVDCLSSHIRLGRHLCCPFRIRYWYFREVEYHRSTSPDGQWTVVATKCMENFPEPVEVRLKIITEQGRPSAGVKPRLGVARRLVRCEGRLISRRLDFLERVWYRRSPSRSRLCNMLEIRGPAVDRPS